MFKLARSAGWVDDVESNVEEEGIYSVFILGGFEVHATYVAATGKFAGRAWRNDYDSEDFSAYRGGGGGVQPR